MYEKWTSMDGWKNKLYSVIKGPGWMPGTPWTGNLYDVPDVNFKTICADLNLLKYYFDRFEDANLLKERNYPFT
jgi:hypothetical protein